MATQQSNINDKTNLPHRLRLGDVLSSIEMTPGEVSAFLSDIAQRFSGGAHPNLSRRFADHAALVTDPQTYGYKPQDNVAAPDAEQYTPPTADSVNYGSASSAAPSARNTAFFDSLNDEPEGEDKSSSPPTTGTPPESIVQPQIPPASTSTPQTPSASGAQPATQPAT